MGTFETSELERVAAAALAGDDPFGRTVLVRAWSDATAVLVIARCEAARTPPRGHSMAAGVAKVQHDVAATFYLRTGELLRPCGRSADPRRGLLVLAFERVGADSLEAHRGSGGRAPLADAS